MLNKVWPNTFVNEANLTQQIFVLRRILGTDESQQYIETIPRRGYRFASTIKELEEEHSEVKPESQPQVAAAAAAAQPSPVEAPTITSLAVLPLTNASDSPNTEYLTDGITESIISNLSQLARLRVMARSTVFRYRGAGADPLGVGATLGVRLVLVGELRRGSDGVEVAAELVDVRDGSQVWSGQYRRRLSSAYELQEEVARAVAEKLFMNLTPGDNARLSRGETDDWEAYHLYLKGRYFLSRREFWKAMRYFEAAAALDKGYARAYAGLADCHSELVQWDEIPPVIGYPAAKEVLLKAMAIDEALAETHTTMAIIKEFFDWEFETAEAEYRRSLSLNPNSALTRRWYSTYLSRCGRWHEALEELKLAQLTDPQPGLLSSKVGRLLYYARQYERALEVGRETIALAPNLADAYIINSLVLVRLGRADEAVEAAVRGRELMGNSVEGLANLGHVYGAVGRRAQAFEVLAELNELSQHRYVPHHMSAVVYAGLGEADETLVRLERAFEERSYYMPALGTLPLFDVVRDDPRFKRLLQRIGLAPQLGGRGS